MNFKKIIIGITGASGIIYGIRLLEMLREADIETYLVMSEAAKTTLPYESDLSVEDVEKLATKVFKNFQIDAAIASGSFKTIGMVIAPCSMHSLACIATGVTSNLLTRAADVVLKERRTLVLLAREAPLHMGHLKNMLAVTEMGGIIYPPVGTFYSRPQTIDDIINHTLGRVLDIFDIENNYIRRWKNDC
ncbi:MAG: UbiX family flavin prenyltransferase [bacterium]|nr:UbiX family flavin prenyltransferase [bacterium]